MANSKHRVELWGRRLRRTMVIGSTALSLAYGYLAIDDLPYSDLINNVNSLDLFRVSAVIFFVLWVAGLEHDIRLQEKTYSHPSFEGEVRYEDYAVIVGIVVIAAIMYYFVDNRTVFSLIITAFVVINILLWRYLLAGLTEAFERSEKHFQKEKDVYASVALAYLKQYLFGNWQYRRFAAMMLAILFFDAVVWIPSLRGTMASAIHARFPSISTSSVNASMDTLVFCGFIAVQEIWIWIERFKVDSIRSALDELEPKYSLKRRS